MDKSAQEHSQDDIDAFIATLDRLKRLALRGDELALDFLWMIGMEGAFTLGNIVSDGCPELKEALQRMATTRLGWPVVASYLDGPEEIKRLMRALHLSERLPYDLRSQITMDPLAKLAYEIVEHIEEASSAWKRRKCEVTKHKRLPMYYKVASYLPSFSRSSLPRWWRVASKVFDRWYPDPAAIPWMCTMVHNGASPGQVRTAVKRRLRQKLLGLAPKL